MFTSSVFLYDFHNKKLSLLLVFVELSTALKAAKPAVVIMSYLGNWVSY